MAIAIAAVMLVTTGTPMSHAVVGGQDATPGAYPFMAAVVSATNPDAYTGHICGATVVASNWVLTAAHCVADETAPDLDVVIDRRDLTSGEGERIAAASIVVHPEYGGRRDNDVALVGLATPTSAPAVPLADGSSAALWAPGTIATVIGWGNTTAVSPPTVLQQGQLPIVSDAECAGSSIGAKVNTALSICAGDLVDGGVDRCHGDSGGPLLVPDQGGGWLEVGIVSWGSRDCGAPNSPGVYVEVAVYSAWIASVVGDQPPPPAPTGTVTGHVFADADASGTENGTETGLAGVAVTVTDDNGTEFDATTGANGDFTVSGVAVGIADVVFTTPAGHVLTTGNATQTVAVSVGSTATTADVGYQPPAGVPPEITGIAESDQTIDPGETRFYKVNVANVDENATFAFSGDGLTAGVVRWKSAQVRLTVTALGTATAGARDLTVTNPDGSSFTFADAITVTG